MENFTKSLILILFLVGVILSGKTLAQGTRVITGKVTNMEGQSVPGATVLVKETATGTVTDIDGNYSFNVGEDAETLVFSFVGMISKEVPIGNQNRINVSLEDDTEELDEVVVIGYGTQRKVTLTGSVATVDSDFLKDRPLTNSSQALQGLNGVYVNQTGGQPGADDATIRIRGIGTLGDNDPLVLVDGIEYNLRDVNPNDIESISVLKDAASAAIYGNRAANGVVLITTKRGQRSERMNIELNSYYGWQRATFLPDMVTSSVDYMIARNQAAFNEGQSVVYSDEAIEEFRNGTDPDLYPNTNWYDILFSVAPIQDHNLRLSGGSENVTYSLSLGYLDQDGILIGTDSKRYSLNTNVTYRYSDKLQFGAIINGSYWDRNEPSVDIESSVLTGAGRSLPIHPNILSDGRYGDTWLVTPGHNVFRHPVAVATESMQNNKSKRAMVNLFAEYTLPFDVKYKATYAVNSFDVYNHRFIPEIFIYNPKEPNVPKTLRFDPPNRSAQRANNNNIDQSFFQTLSWDGRNLADKHNLNLLLGFSRESFYRSNFNAYIEGFLGNELTELNAGTINQSVGGTSNESKLMSYFGRANYSYMDKYLLETNFRYDGSSRFAEENRWGFFPSFSAAWRIGEEAFMQNLGVIDDLKFRGSWGQLGNQNIGLFNFVSNININQGTILENNVVPGSAITALADPNISWEKTTITNLGMDLSLWENKMEIVVDLYNKVTTDILTRVNIPSQVGNLAGPITNLYGMSNRGVEINATHRNTIGDLRFQIGANVAYVDNKVDYLAGDIQYATNTYGNIRIIKEGHPVNSWYLYEAEGIFQTQEEVDSHAFQHAATSPGDIKFRDVNNDGVIDIEDMDIRGRALPKYTYGFNLNMDFKGLDLSAFFQGVYDVDIYPWHNVAFPLYNGAGITKEYLENHWTPENPDAKYPRLFLPKRGTLINSANSTFWLQDASYLRLKNLQIGYTIQSDLLSRANISKFRPYINAQNLLTFSKWKLSDPEKDILRQNIGDYPNALMVTLGFNLIF
jgi:TonB-linked SusC/RagA family outer membrane protein